MCRLSKNPGSHKGGVYLRPYRYSYLPTGGKVKPQSSRNETKTEWNVKSLVLSVAFFTCQAQDKSVLDIKCMSVFSTRVEIFFFATSIDQFIFEIRCKFQYIECSVFVVVRLLPTQKYVRILVKLLIINFSCSWIVTRWELRWHQQARCYSISLQTPGYRL